ncbi:DNA-binding protein [Pelotomaculum schinkii]
MLISEASKKWGITTRRIQTLCIEGRIKDAEKAGSIWLIPKNTEKPADARIKSGKYIGYCERYKNKKKLNSDIDP